MSEQINGEWIGYYSYGEMYPPHLQSMKCGFAMKLNLNGNSLNGTCEDDDMKGKLDTPANINGNVDSHQLKFKKQYPFAFSIDQNGTVHKNPNQTPPFIEYEGKFDPSSNSCDGIWKITAMEDNGRNSMVEKVYSGPWSMKKK
jgi:hypothetical protein